MGDLSRLVSHNRISLSDIIIKLDNFLHSKLLRNCVICINCHLGLSCVNNVFCYSLPGIGGQSYVDTANNNNNKLCPSLAKFNFIHVFVFYVRNMHKYNFEQRGDVLNRVVRD